MKIVHSDAQPASCAARAADAVQRFLAAADYMEDNLRMPLADVLQNIQNRVVNNTTYCGIKTLRNPLDAWVYQEIIFETKPDVIVEIGISRGGGLLSLAHVCDSIGKGRLIGVDATHAHVHEMVRKHPRITLIEGDACQSFEKVARLVPKDARVMIIEDSSHSYENTLHVLRTYSALIQPGDYFIVEDSICWHGLACGPSPGPYEAIESFISENREFEMDRERESFFITWNPKGYLRRVGCDDAMGNSKEGGYCGKLRRKGIRRLARETAELLLPPILVRWMRNAARAMKG